MARLAAASVGHNHSSAVTGMKVLGVGYPRTGTKTLGVCFRVFGYRNASWDGSIYEKYLQGDIGGILRYAEEFDSFEDLPWCSMYKEFDERFSETKFILTVRKDEHTWYQSYRTHEYFLARETYLPLSGPLYESSMNLYRDHNRSVREYFRDRPDDLLEVCWEDKHGWSELASFLNETLPEVKFPHKNRTPPAQADRLREIYLRQLGNVGAGTRKTP